MFHCDCDDDDDDDVSSAVLELAVQLRTLGAVKEVFRRHEIQGWYRDVSEKSQ